MNELEEFKTYWNDYQSGKEISFTKLVELANKATPFDPSFVSYCMSTYKISKSNNRQT